MKVGFKHMAVDDWKGKIASGEEVEQACLIKNIPQDDGETKIVASERKVLITISTASVDRDRDTIDQDGWITEYYERNPVVLFAHKYDQLPIATGELVREQGRLRSWDSFFERDIYPLADTIYRMMTLPVPGIRMASVGFSPVSFEMNEDRRGVDFKQQELLEHSIVPIGSNRDAIAASKAILGKDIMKPLVEWCEIIMDEYHDEKGLWVPRDAVEQAFKELTPRKITVNTDLESPEHKYVPRDVSRSLANEGASWARPTLGDFTDESFEDLSASQRRRIAGHYGYSVSNPPETFADLKLPHHRPSDGSVVFRGVAAAMAALLGARGGVDVPDDERRAIYNHLNSHYRQFNREAPEFRFVEAQVLKNTPEVYEFDDEGQLSVVIVPRSEVNEIDDFLASIRDSNGYDDEMPSELASVEVEDLATMAVDAIKDLVADALKSEIMRTTGRLID